MRLQLCDAVSPNFSGDNNHQVRKPLENIIDPNAFVPFNHRVSVIELEDGRILTNMIPEPTDRTITVQSQIERFVIEPKKITSPPFRNRTSTPP